MDFGLQGVRMTGGKEASLEAVHKALGKGLSVKSIQKTALAQAAEVHTVKIKGLG